MRSVFVKRLLCAPSLFALLCAGLAAPVIATPGYRSQADALREGQAVVAHAAGRDVDGAFTRAVELSRAEDGVMQARLDAQKRDVGTSATNLGALRSVSPVEETVFAGCVTHRYLVRYAEGRQRWMLKYRRGVQGWYLADLHVEKV